MVYRLINFKLSHASSQWQVVWYLQDELDRIFLKTTDLPFRDYFFCAESQLEVLQDYVKQNFEEYEKIIHSIEPMDDTHTFELYEFKDEVAYKVNMANPYVKWDLRESFELDTKQLVFEADISYSDLLQKDLGISEFVSFKDNIPYAEERPSDFPELRMVFFDFEWDDRPSVIQQSEMTHFVKSDVCRMLSCSFTDAKTGVTKFVSELDEKELLLQVKKELYKYHVVSAWNGHNADKKMKDRFDLHDIPFDWERFIFLDSMSIAFVLDAKETHFLISLDQFAKRHLNEQKIKHRWGFYEAFEMYHKGENKELEEYNKRDTELMYRLYQKLGFEDIILNLGYNKNICVLPQSIIFSRKPSIQAIMRFSLDHFGKRIIWKSRSSIPTKEGYIGAITFEPEKGIHDNVIGIDLASLYNNIIQTWNISPEQLMLNDIDARTPLADQFGKTDFTHSYDRFDHMGIMPRVLKVFEEDRNKYKKLRGQSKGEMFKLYDTIQAGLKVVLLSITGGLGARGSTAAKSRGDDISEQEEDEKSVNGARSFYSWHCASDFTAFAREIITKASDIAEEEYGWKRVYGDTDSIYVKLPENEEYDTQAVIKIMTELVMRVNAEYENILDFWKIPKDRRTIQMESQGWYSPFALFDAKKRYFARLRYNAENDEAFDDDTIEIYAKGVEYVKSTTPDFIQRFQKEIFERVLKGESRESLNKYVTQVEQDLLNGVYDKELVFHKTLRKAIDDYDTKGLHVRLAEEIRAKQGTFEEFSTVFFYIHHVDPISKKAVAMLDTEVDGMKLSGREYVWNRRIKTWLHKTLDLLPDNEQQTLEAFL